MKTFKLISCFIVVLFIISSCSKKDENTIDPTIDPPDCPDVVEYEYDVFIEDLNYYTMNFECEPLSTVKCTIECDTIAVFFGNRLPFVEETNDYKRFEKVDPGTTPNDYTRKLKICKNSNDLFYSSSNNYAGAPIYIYTPSDSAHCQFSFKHKYCDSGTQHQLCYSSKDKLRCDSFAITNYSVTVDSSNLYLDLNFLGFVIRIPTDATLQILTGSYWLGTVPSGGQPILDCSFNSYNYGMVTFSDFTTGYLKIDKVGQDFVFSWRLHSCNQTVWSGYMKAP